MANKNTTKRVLVLSVLALLLCFTMLLGTTFAWFTDTVKSGVNVIKSGTLDVVLEYKDATDAWVDAVDQTLEFKTADDRAEILWEPGCTYVLPAVRVRNNGNLALKYSITINGAQGEAKLLDVIDWVVTVDGVATTLEDLNGMLLATESTGEIVISGHMQETAGNEYQDLELYGIGVTVFATQATYENDSFDDQYDAAAPEATQAQINALAKQLAEAADGSVIELEALDYKSISLSSGSYTYATYAKNLTIVGQAGTQFKSFVVGNRAIEGWTFKDVTFYADGLQFTTDAEINGVTLDGCNFIDGAHVSVIKTNNVSKANFTVKNCTFVGCDPESPAILLQGTENVVVTGNTFTGIGHNAVQLTKITTDVVITDNVIDGTTDRPLRLSVTSACNVTITGNTINSDGDANGQLMKIGGGDKVTLTMSGNTWNGQSDAEVYAELVDTDYIVKNN